MPISARHACDLCFRTTLLFGMAWTFIGLFVIPILPWAQLDRVLSPEELADEQKKEATRELLQQSAGNAWLFWTGAGISLILVSIVGLVSVHRLKQQAEVPEGAPASLPDNADNR